MAIKILVFGSLTDIIGDECIIKEVPHDTNTLLSFMKQKFTLLNERKFVIAVDKKIVSENVAITNSSEIALLPPFSGG